MAFPRQTEAPSLPDTDANTDANKHAPNTDTQIQLAAVFGIFQASR